MVLAHVLQPELQRVTGSVSPHCRTRTEFSPCLVLADLMIHFLQID